MANGLRLSLRSVLVLCVLALVSVAGPSTAVTASGAANFTVNSSNDAPADFTTDPGFNICRTNVANSTCTLRAAIMNANHNPAGAVIHLPAGTYFIQIPRTFNNDDETVGDLNISTTVTIFGAGATSTIVDGNGLGGVFAIEHGAAANISGLTVRNANTGGAIQNYGSLNLADSVLTASRQGGGLFSLDATTTTVTNVSVTNNLGGGIFAEGALTITNSTISGNIQDSGDGGGIVTGDQANVKISNSTISNNSARFNGGGIRNTGTMSILASTITGNLADNQAAGGHFGGGIYDIFAGTLQLANTLVADNYVSRTVNECAGNPITSLDYNYIQTLDGCMVNNVTTNNISPGANRLLARLGDYGGATQTRALLVGNPAIDQIPPALCRDLSGTAPVPDQRGVARPIGSKCDIGAYEGALALAPFGRNLVFNGDAESAAGSPNGGYVGVPGWDRAPTSQFTAVTYNATGGFPSIPTDTVPLNHGANFFAGGFTATSIVSQVISLNFPEILPSIDAGQVSYVFSVDIGGFFNQDDTAFARAEFFNQTNASLSSITFAGPSAAARNNQTGLFPRSVHSQVPPTARSVVVTIRMVRLSSAGPYNDGYVDNISLVLLPRATLFLPLITR